MPTTKLNYLLTCDQAFSDEKNKLSIIGVFDRIQSKAVPAIHPRFSIVVNTTGDLNSSHLEKIEIINLQNNLPVASLEQQINFTSSNMHNFLGNFINTLFPNFGKYWIKVSIDEKIITNQEQHYVSVEQA